MSPKSLGVRWLQAIQSYHVLAMIAAPFPIFHFQHFLKHKAEFDFGYDEFFAMLIPEIALAVITLILTNAVYRRGSRFNPKIRRQVIVGCAVVALFFYILNLYILWLLIGVIYLLGGFNIFWTQLEISTLKSTSKQIVFGG